MKTKDAKELTELLKQWKCVKVSTPRIKDKHDLKKALDRFEELWHVRPGDDDWEERAALTDAIEEYEDKYLPEPWGKGGK